MTSPDAAARAAGPLWLGQRRGQLTDWATQRWVQLTGRRVALAQAPWLAGPVGDTLGIGARFFEAFAEREGLVLRHSADGGLVPDADVLAAPGFHARALDPAVAAFYARTAMYELELWSEWAPAFRPLGRLVAWTFSRRLQQLNVPLGGLDPSRGLTNEILQLVDPRDGAVRHTVWLRRLVRSGHVAYAGVYSTSRVPGHDGACVKVVFPLPNGNAVVLMRPVLESDGSLSLVSSGRAFGDPGFYFTVDAGDGAVWARYVPSMREHLHVFADAPDVRADHVFTLWGATFLRLHYRLRPTAAAPTAAPVLP